MNRRSAIRLAVAASAAAVLLALALVGLPVISFLAKLALFAVGALGLIWLLARAYQAFLWKVGRRLAFSYFLIGVLPIPMLALVGLAAAYLMANFLLGHLYRDAVHTFNAELTARAEAQLTAYLESGRPGAQRREGLAFDYYRGGRRAAGAGMGPEEWPQWLSPPAATNAGGTDTASPNGGATVAGSPVADSTAAEPHRLLYVVGADGAPTVAVALQRDDGALVAVFDGDLGEELRRRSGLWIEVHGSTELKDEADVVSVSGSDIQLGSGERAVTASDEARQEFFAGRAAGDGKWDQPVLYNLDRGGGALYRLADGEEVDRSVAAVVNATPRMLLDQLFTGTAEHDLLAWGLLIALTLVLGAIYLAAVLVALAMIFGLSRAVNRLSKATSAVQRGDFSVRIDARRRDQLGALQRSFNQMAANLESLVATAAQKEVLEHELEIARELQESLLPSDLPRGETVEFATLFEPSAAIGGDYFDILRLDDRRLAVVIADVSGHGLSSGLRMAMLKAALLILVDEERQPLDILARLDALVRGNAEKRFFVTATLALIDLAAGRLELTNAGHLPTYLLRSGEVREIALPSSALGGLGSRFAQKSVELEPGDLVVWLSDGLVEATDRRGEPFGFERVEAALAGAVSSPLEVRSRLLAAVAEHASGEPEDDRTLVVMHYHAQGGTVAASSGAAGEGAEA